MKLKPILYYVSVFIVIMGFVQFIIALIDGKKILMLNSRGEKVQGIIIDKFIQERFQGPETGYRLHFFNDSLDTLYGNHFFKSYNDKYNQGDTLCVLHYAPNPDLSRLCGFRDAYSDGLANLAISIALLIAGWIGIKKYALIMRYLKGQ
ncbi:MAG: hypothetical protein ABI723_15460 [Bacteroidia bacterium]